MKNLKEFWIYDNGEEPCLAFTEKPDPNDGGIWAEECFHVMETKDFIIKMRAALNYCEPYLDKMWSARIVGILLGCDWKDAKEHLEIFYDYLEEEGF